MGTLGAIAAIISALVAAGGTAYNIYSTNKTNAQNQANTQKEWNREDNSVQRRVADLQAAGLSPVLAAGSGATTSAPIKIDAPQVSGDLVSGAMDALKGSSDLATAKLVRQQQQEQIELLKKQQALSDADLLAKQVATQGGVIQNAKADQEVTSLKMQNQVLSHDLQHIMSSPFRSDAPKLLDATQSFFSDFGKRAGNVLESAQKDITAPVAPLMQKLKDYNTQRNANLDARLNQIKQKQDAARQQSYDSKRARAARNKANPYNR